MKLLRSLVPVLVVLAFAGCATPPPSKPNPVETAALVVLASDAGLKEKARACQELGYFGGPASVPALAALLKDETLSNYARSGLEGIKDPAAGAALRQALPTLNGRLLAGAVNSLGVRREVAAVADLQKLALDGKRGAAPEAVASLGLIANRDAVSTLKKVLADGPAELRAPAAHASLVAAEQLAKAGEIAAARDLLNSVVRALPAGHLQAAAQRQAAGLGHASHR
jgi:HEAT repeat protein